MINIKKDDSKSHLKFILSPCSHRRPSSISLCTAVPFALLDLPGALLGWEHEGAFPMWTLASSLLVSHAQCGSRTLSVGEVSLGWMWGWNHQGGGWAHCLLLLCSRTLAAVNLWRCLGGREGDLTAGARETWWQATGSPAMNVTLFSLGAKKRGSSIKPSKSDHFCPVSALWSRLK